MKHSNISNEKPALNVGSVSKRVYLENLKINDLFYMEFLHEIKIFRVHKIFENTGILAHIVGKPKSSSILLRFDTNIEIFYAGKISKVREFFCV